MPSKTSSKETFPLKMQLFLLSILVSCFLFGVSQGKLRVGFYSQSCPNAESIVGSVVREATISDENNVPILLRLHFHDCFVEGCDGSILIDTGRETDERRAAGHQGVRGFDIIDKAKAKLEIACPRIVSCADIVAMAARDAVFLARGPWYDVETGRRDGTVSDVKFAAKMPDVGDSIQTLKAKFFAKGLNDKDLVLLSAAHTIGTTACFFMDHRLYQFPAAGQSDPSINPAFLSELKSTCPKNGNANTRLSLDRMTPKIFDRKILINIRNGFAVLQSDASLYQAETTRRIVDSYFGIFSMPFEADFAKSMVNMGGIGVHTGSKGTIRRLCSSFS